MVVLENNNKITCPYCKSVLEVTQSDITEGYMGTLTVDCPCCGEEIDYGEVEVTIDNIKFPTHFFYFGKNNKKQISEKEVREFIQNAVTYFREHKDNYGFYYSGGRHLLIAKRYPGDKEYAIMIANDYYSADIPFEDEDKWEGWNNFDEDDD